jgi:hypothetical protein
MRRPNIMNRLYVYRCIDATSIACGKLEGITVHGHAHLL